MLKWRLTTNHLFLKKKKKKKTLLNTPTLLQRKLLRTQKCNYSVVYKKGTELLLADTLSRSVKKNTTGIKKMEKEKIFKTHLGREVENIKMASYISVSEERLAEL